VNVLLKTLMKTEAHPHKAETVEVMGEVMGEAHPHPHKAEAVDSTALLGAYSDP
jgi:hypothetical protein